MDLHHSGPNRPFASLSPVTTPTTPEQQAETADLVLLQAEASLSSLASIIKNSKTQSLVPSFKMPPASPEPKSLFLAISFLLVAYLTNRCWTPPNPDLSRPNAALPKDTVGISSSATRGKRLATLALWILHILLTISYPSPPILLCPNPDNLAKPLFTWSPYTTSILAVVVTTAPIRLLSFRHLGRNFTFLLAEPQELVKTGLYAYVQHPSYPTNWLISSANVALLMRLDGVLGCALPGRVVRWGMGSGGGVGVWPVLLVGAGMRGLYAVWERVKDEEAMLQRVMGTEWEEYHRRTARFMPGVF